MVDYVGLVNVVATSALFLFHEKHTHVRVGFVKKPVSLLLILIGRFNCTDFVRRPYAFHDILLPVHILTHCWRKIYAQQQCSSQFASRKPEVKFLSNATWRKIHILDLLCSTNSSVFGFTFFLVICMWVFSYLMTLIFMYIILYIYIRAGWS